MLARPRSQDIEMRQSSKLGWSESIGCHDPNGDLKTLLGRKARGRGIDFPVLSAKTFCAVGGSQRRRFLGFFGLSHSIGWSQAVAQSRRRLELVMFAHCFRHHVPGTGPIQGLGARSWADEACHAINRRSRPATVLMAAVAAAAIMATTAANSSAVLTLLIDEHESAENSNPLSEPLTTAEFRGVSPPFLITNNDFQTRRSAEFGNISFYFQTDTRQLGVANFTWIIRLFEPRSETDGRDVLSDVATVDYSEIAPTTDRPYNNFLSVTFGSDPGLFSASCAPNTPNHSCLEGGAYTEVERYPFNEFFLLGNFRLQISSQAPPRSVPEPSSVLSLWVLMLFCVLKTRRGRVGQEAQRRQPAPSNG